MKNINKRTNAAVLLFILVLLASEKSTSVRPAIARICQRKLELLCEEKLGLGVGG
jgi:hypothetical protein